MTSTSVLVLDCEDRTANGAKLFKCGESHDKFIALCALCKHVPTHSHPVSNHNLLRQWLQTCHLHPSQLHVREIDSETFS